LDRLHPDRVLRGDRRDRARPVHAAPNERLQISLDAGPAAGVGPRDRERGRGSPARSTGLRGGWRIGHTGRLCEASARAPRGAPRLTGACDGDRRLGARRRRPRPYTAAVLPAAVDAELVRPLRREVLRPGASAHELRYPHDEAPSTLHAAVAAEGGRVVAVASIMREPHPRDPRPGDWRLRGMATSEDMRGRGIGRALLSFCEAHARRASGARVWCNARVGARSFYDRAGFAVEGAEFEIPGIGRHLLMSKPLE
jgi:GNAT superfamily N-acetyltransferase